MSSKSITALRNRHLELLEKTRREEVTPETLAEVKEFIEQCRNAGRCLSSIEDREYVRSLLLEWGKFIYRQSDGAEYVDLGLLPFEGESPWIKNPLVPFVEGVLCTSLVFLLLKGVLGSLDFTRRILLITFLLLFFVSLSFFIQLLAARRQP